MRIFSDMRHPDTRIPLVCSENLVPHALIAIQRIASFPSPFTKMLPLRLLILTIAVTVALVGCTSKEEEQTNSERDQSEAAENTPENTSTDAAGESAEEASQEEESRVVTVEETARPEVEEPAGPVLQPRFIPGERYERTVQFRSHRETRAERNEQQITGSMDVEWSVSYAIVPQRSANKRQLTLDIEILDVSATRDSSKWDPGHLPQAGTSYRCRREARKLRCDGMAPAVSDFAPHWLYGTWADFVPSGVVTAGERWQRRGTFGTRFGIEGDQPTIIDFEVAAIETLDNGDFRVQHDLGIESEAFWETPVGQRQVEITGSGDAEYDSLTGVMSSIDMGWDGMLVHEGRVGRDPYRFTRREEARIQVDTLQQEAPATSDDDNDTEPSEPAESAEDETDSGVGLRPY
jgi:hypothetical protein